MTGINEHLALTVLAGAAFLLLIVSMVLMFSWFLREATHARGEGPLPGPFWPGLCVGLVGALLSAAVFWQAGALG